MYKMEALRTDGARNAFNAGILSQSEARTKFQESKNIENILSGFEEKLSFEETIDNDDEHCINDDIEDYFRPISADEVALEIYEFTLPGIPISSHVYFWQHARYSTHALQLSVKLG